jgi:hypothetical protein
MALLPPGQVTYCVRQLECDVKPFAVCGRFYRRKLLLLALVVGLSVACASYYRLTRHSRVAVLNGLRDEINAHYGYRDGGPCVNWGPCGRFANAFREQWNARFREKVNIAFVMAPDGSCHHVVVKFPDGSYFDGGNGVMSEGKLLTLYGHDDRIEEMVEFDLSLLDQRVGGLNREHYSWCPNYSDSLTAKLIEKHLALLASDLDESAVGR